MGISDASQVSTSHSALRCANQKCGVLDAIAVRVILVSAPALVGVEEVLIIVLRRSKRSSRRLRVRRNLLEIGRNNALA